MQAAENHSEQTPNLDRAMRKLAAEVQLYRRRGRRADARFLESVLETIQDAREEDRNRVLSITETAHAGGYSPRHVRRMVGTTVANANPHGVPGIRYRDVPRKKKRQNGGPPRRPASRASGDTPGAVKMVVLEGEE
jgi:hypothetical protein